MRSSGGESGAFHFHIDLHIGVCGLYARMAEPATHDVKINATLQKMERGTMPEGMWTDRFVSEFRIRLSRLSNTSPYNKSKPKASKRVASGTEEKGLVRFFIRLSVPKHVT